MLSPFFTLCTVFSCHRSLTSYWFLIQALEGKEGWSRTRAAITVALGEMSVLESAWTSWGELSAVLEDLSARA